MRSLLVLPVIVVGVDDTTMNLMAKVDPLPPSSGTSASSLLQDVTRGRPAFASPDETYVPINFMGNRSSIKTQSYGTTIMTLGRDFTPAPSTGNETAIGSQTSSGSAVAARGPRGVRSLNYWTSAMTQRAMHVAPRIHSTLSDVSESSLNPPPIVPDVFICSLPSGKNGLSVRTCDTVPQSPALLAQVLRCSDRIHPSTVVDLFMGRQEEPIDLSKDDSRASNSVLGMETPVSVDVSFPACDSDRSVLPNLDISQDYIAFVLVNPDVERAAENFSLIHGATASFRAGIVFVAIPKLFDDSSAVNLKGIVATGFAGPIQNCLVDGVCSASELVNWTNQGVPVDYLVGTSQGVVRLTGTSRVASSG